MWINDCFVIAVTRMFQRRETIIGDGRFGDDCGATAFSSATFRIYSGVERTRVCIDAKSYIQDHRLRKTSLLRFRRERKIRDDAIATDEQTTCDLRRRSTAAAHLKA